MSIESWIEEYYPILAVDTIKAQALDHSIRKWTGATNANLFKHGLKAAPISFTATTCALCVHHNKDKDWINHPCESCPIVEATGGPCDYNEETSIAGFEPLDEYSPYSEWVRNKNPRPMLALLDQTKEWVDE